MDLQQDEKNPLRLCEAVRLLQSFTMATFNVVDFTTKESASSLAITCLPWEIKPKFSG